MRTHILGFPSIGKQRELKEALESFWQGGLSAESLYETCAALKKRHWRIQKEAGLDFVSTGDFSLYDRMLDITCMLGAVPPRFAPCRGDTRLDRYFNLARGDVKRNIAALEMTKWFDTNYHYIVPEFTKDQSFKILVNKPLQEYNLAKKHGFDTKPVLIGLVTYLLLGKEKEQGFNRLDLADRLLPVYLQLVESLVNAGAKTIQIDDPLW